ncbi:hypothetical protein LG047_12660 [Methylocystis sp. WRRC1]|nr:MULTISPECIES: hypothetical protein [unclassified Methylocystis]MCC3246161.1 hypothetical protein [Methylocystis sp. WRRC1]
MRRAALALAIVALALSGCASPEGPRDALMIGGYVVKKIVNPRTGR